jgi:hypothetical protein
METVSAVPAPQTPPRRSIPATSTSRMHADTMTSLALAHHAAPAFNADFYTVAATIIPVLFLALVVQGPAYEQLLRFMHRIGARITGELRPAQLGATLAYFAAFAAGLAVVAAGAQDSPVRA